MSSSSQSTSAAPSEEPAPMTDVTEPSSTPNSASATSSSAASEASANAEAASSSSGQSGDESKKRKRGSWWDKKSRLLPPDEAASNSSNGTSTALIVQGEMSVVAEPKKKKSRWGAEDDRVKDLPPNAATMTDGLSPEQTEMYLLRARIETINKKLLNPLDGPRSPSPEPVYDSTGRRTNTRIQRVTQRLNKERSELVQQLLKLTSAQMTAAGLPVPAAATALLGLGIAGNTKFEKRLPIPTDKYPDYNFKGVIIGPRGANQQKLEKETGCHISVRGKGARIRKLPPMPDDDEPLHVFVQADSQEKLDKAVAEVEKLLVPMSEEERRRQMREVAIINGTWKPPQPCKVCGEDHHVYQCPVRTSTWQSANVVCEYCGERNHLSADCPVQRRVYEGGGVTVAQKPMALEYDTFLDELSTLTGGSSLNMPRLLTMSGSTSSGGGSSASSSAAGPTLALPAPTSAASGSSLTPAPTPAAAPVSAAAPAAATPAIVATAKGPLPIIPGLDLPPELRALTAPALSSSSASALPATAAANGIHAPGSNSLSAAAGAGAGAGAAAANGAPAPPPLPPPPPTPAPPLTAQQKHALNLQMQQQSLLQQQAMQRHLELQRQQQMAFAAQMQMQMAYGAMPPGGWIVAPPPPHAQMPMMVPMSMQPAPMVPHPQMHASAHMMPPPYGHQPPPGYY